MPVSSRSRRRGSGQDSGYKSHESSAHSQEQCETETPRVREQKVSIQGFQFELVSLVGLKFCVYWICCQTGPSFACPFPLSPA